MRRALMVMVAIGVAGCVPTVEQPASTRAAGEPLVSTQLRAADGTDRGTATLARASERMRITVDATNLTPGIRAVHIHEVGRCDAPDFMTAKGHWNPTARQHGRDNPMGAHHGDLPNLTVGADGRGSISFEVAGTLAELLDADGAAVMVHADADDYRTDPTGNAGKRVACGVLTAP